MREDPAEEHKKLSLQRLYGTSADLTKMKADLAAIVRALMFEAMRKVQLRTG